MIMLKINNISEKKAPEVIVDEYVPLSIRFDPDCRLPPLYWRGGNGKTSLLEIGVSRSSGVIVSVTVVTVASVSFLSGEGLSEADSVALGVPVCDVREWSGEGGYSDDFLDDFSADFDLVMGVSNVAVVFRREASVSRFVKSGNVCFGVSLDGELLSIDVSCLSSVEMSVLEKLIN
ncbi:hypothetical protein QS468_12845 [Bacillus subtilis]|jgi:hypothetical protein|nr:hypothetical protein [Pseudomonas sp. A29(2023)]MDL5593598.1 hypothetical protein [Bacillus subtilis]